MIKQEVQYIQEGFVDFFGEFSGIVEEQVFLSSEQVEFWDGQGSFVFLELGFGNINLEEFIGGSRDFSSGRILGCFQKQKFNGQV